MASLNFAGCKKNMFKTLHCSVQCYLCISITSLTPPHAWLSLASFGTHITGLVLTLRWRPFGPVDFILRTLRVLRPCEPRICGARSYIKWVRMPGTAVTCPLDGVKALRTNQTRNNAVLVVGFAEQIQRRRRKIFSPSRKTFQKKLLKSFSRVYIKLARLQQKRYSKQIRLSQNILFLCQIPET